MKFDFVIGNPPYQDTALGDNKTYTPPVYNKFMDEAFTISDRVLLIHPARFLFNAGSTPKQWNEKMLKDEHFKVVEYESDCNKYFSNTEIKGGIAITYRNKREKFGAIETFTPYPELNAIFHKVSKSKKFASLSEIVVTSFAYHFTKKLHKDHPEVIHVMSKGHADDLKSNVFDRLSNIFLQAPPNGRADYIKILGRENNKRVFRFIQRDYINQVVNLDCYKIFISRSNGAGKFGEVLSPPIIGEPAVGSTESFFSIGNFDTITESENCIKFVKTKFCRALLNVLKVTQDITPEKWKYVPLQDFSSKSDIDWSKPIADIDKQLYKKYRLTKSEIEFIESHVKEME